MILTYTFTVILDDVYNMTFVSKAMAPVSSQKVDHNFLSKIIIINSPLFVH